LLQAPELASYQDEPPQLPTGSPGKVAHLRLGFERREARSILADLFRRAPLIVHRAIYWDEEMPDMPCVFIVSNSGGILQGDRNTISIEVGSDAQAHVTTQSATKIHEMDANFAAQFQEIVLHDNAYLEYLPDPVIPHRRTRFLTDTRVAIAPTATLLYSEILMAGRKYYSSGELYEYDLFSSTVRAGRPEGRELFTEKYVVRPRLQSVRRVGMMGEFDVFGNVILLTPKPHADRIFEQIPAVVNLQEKWAAGASRLPNEAGLIYKVVGMETAPVRARIREFWTVVRSEVVGARVPREFAWR
jgi:urease accessory protein